MDEVQALAEEAFGQIVAADPLGASVLFGVRDRDGELPDLSRAAEDAQLAAAADLARRAAAVEPTDPVQRVTAAVIRSLSERRADVLGQRTEEFATGPFFVGAQARLLTLLPKVRVEQPAHAADYRARLRQVDAYLAQSAGRLREGLAAGRVAAAHPVRGSMAQIDDYLGRDLAADPFLVPLPTDERAEAEDLVRDVVRPALARYRGVLGEEVLPHARDDASCGLSALPDGERVYAALVRDATTTDRTPDELHRLGLEIVGQLAEEYRERSAEALGTSDLDDVFGRLRDDPSLRFGSAAQIVTVAERAIAVATEAAPDWFGTLPVAPCRVEPLPDYEAKDAVAAYYTPPPEGGGPGTYWINTRGPETRSRVEAEAIAFHEGVPGHHLQLALAAEMEGMPRLRRFGLENAYIEGWGLYAERLADEMGLYSSPLDRLGVLCADSLRACRLVVDTGLHAFGWSRRRAIDYLIANCPLTPEVLIAEADRYVVLPGQALGYMVGRLELQRLRTAASDRLGQRFALRDFHDVVLGAGALPLDVLGEVVDAWAPPGPERPPGVGERP